jgi:DNA-binding IclR family transcriptional regulator
VYQTFGHVKLSTTVDKALSLLELFTAQKPEIGLSEVARLADIDKATAHRLLSALATRGFLEQDEQSRLYRLGVSVVRLARYRESVFPLESVVESELTSLAQVTGETCHASMLAGSKLATVGYVEGSKAIHVTLEQGQLLHLHATASGLACLAFMSEARQNSILRQPMEKFTSSTPVKPEAIKRLIAGVQKAGFAIADQTYESDVFGVAAPLFGAEGFAQGAVAVATPAHRMTKEIRMQTASLVMDAATRITRKLGFEPPASYSRLIQRAVA